MYQKREIYLDNSSTTKPCQQANEEYLHAVTECYGNPSSLHRKGFEAERLVENTKSELSRALGCKAGEIIFTSGATEANNLAIKGAAAAYPRRGKRIVITAIEHPSVIEAAEELKKQGYEVVKLSPDEQGEYTPEMFEEAADKNTLLVSTMWVNNETGLLLPIEKIGAAIKRKNPEALYHVDGVQGFLKLPVKLSATQIDLFSLSGHKAYAPKGIGALFVKSGVRLNPIINGGGQQGNIRSGTEPVSLIAALGGAVRQGLDEFGVQSDRLSELREYLIKALSGDERVRLHLPKRFAPHILSVAVGGVRSETMLHYLEQRNIFVSSGSACKKGKQSYVLAAMGIKQDEADSTLRISLGRETTQDDLDELVKWIFEGLETLAKKGRTR